MRSTKARKTKKNPKPLETWKKIAASRGKKWRQALTKGHIEAQANPTTMRLIRVQKGLDQETVSGSLGIHVNVFGSIERGKTPVKEVRAKEIAKYYGKDVNALFQPHKLKGKYVAKKNASKII